MTNKELQKELDLQRYYASEKHEGDMSGLMPYCSHCKYQQNGCNCFVPYSQMAEENICAEAYKNMQKSAKM